MDANGNTQPLTAGRLADIPVTMIRPGNNDRKHFEPNALRVLADSIAKDGLAMRPLVRPMDGGAWYQIVAGERRFRAMSTLLNWDCIPVVIRELSDEQASALMLTENTARVDLDPIAEAQAYESRRALMGWTDKEIATRAGVSVERVQKRRALLSLTPDIQHYVKIGQFPLGHALLIADLDPDRQRIAIRAFNAAPTMALYKFQAITEPLRAALAEESQFDMFADLELLVEDEVKKLTESPKPAPLTGKKAAAELTRLTELVAKVTAGASVDIDTMLIALHALQEAGANRVTVTMSETGALDLTGDSVEPLTMTIDPVTDEATITPESDITPVIGNLTKTQLTLMAARFHIGAYSSLTDAPAVTPPALLTPDERAARWRAVPVLSTRVTPALAHTA